MIGATSLYGSFVEIDLTKQTPPRIVRRRIDKPMLSGEDVSLVRIPAPANLTQREKGRLVADLKPLAQTLRDGHDVRSINGQRPQAVLSWRARRALERAHRVVRSRTRGARLRDAARRHAAAWVWNRRQGLRTLSGTLRETRQYIRDDLAEHRRGRERARAAALWRAEQSHAPATEQDPWRNPWFDLEQQVATSRYPAGTAPVADDAWTADRAAGGSFHRVGDHDRDGHRVVGYLRRNPTAH